MNERVLWLTLIVLVLYSLWRLAEAWWKHRRRPARADKQEASRQEISDHIRDGERDMLALLTALNNDPDTAAVEFLTGLSPIEVGAVAATTGKYMLAMIRRQNDDDVGRVNEVLREIGLIFAEEREK